MGSKPKRQQAGSHEKELVAQGAAGMNQFNARYAPIQEEFAQEAGRDYSDRMAGQGRVGAARAMSLSAPDVALGNAQLNAGGLTAAGMQGKAAAHGMQVERLGVANALHNGQKAQTTASLTSLAQGQANINNAKHQGKQLVRGAQMSALGTLAGAGATYAGLEYATNKKAKQ